jgi:hypothetical protein
MGYSTTIRRIGGFFQPVRTLCALLLVIAATQAQAQVKVDIELKRTLYMIYEPIVCKVTIENLSGRMLDLSDTPTDKWFGFQIETIDGRPLPPLNSDYRNEPVQIPSGTKLVRNINITPLFALGEFGTYRVQASVFSSQLNKYFSSPRLNIEITEGRLLWTQTVGVPPGSGSGQSRTISVLAHRLPQTSMLYLRMEDKDSGIIYCTTQLGRFVAFSSPDIQLDGANQVHIIQNIAPRAFLYSHFDLDGKVVKQQAYQLDKNRPYLAKASDSSISVVGGTPYDPNAVPEEKKLPKLSDRPVPLPTPQTQATPEDKRPENLLSR